MPLATGTKLGPYEILAAIGAGGMGEVYRAKDTRLGRDVAIKVSKEQFSGRFEREARAVATLNHPNICTLFDVGHNYLVMEFVAGPTLADRIKEGPIPLDEALTMARQMADALEAAHERGIVHRDLKPANVKIKDDGAVKVLDFGLAKVVVEQSDANDDSPTILTAPTEQGMILGTAGYMSPEQARGRSVDKRTDIWAFGVVLFEMLTGRRLFQGEGLTETLASVVKENPDLSPVPRQVRRLLRKCLEKDPRKRLRDIGDVWELLEDVAPSPAAGLVPVRGSKWPWAVALLMTMASAALTLLYFRQTHAAANTFRVTIAPPENSSVQSFVVSPDGRLLVMAASVNSSSGYALSMRYGPGRCRPQTVPRSPSGPPIAATSASSRKAS